MKKIPFLLATCLGTAILGSLAQAAPNPKLALDINGDGAIQSIAIDGQKLPNALPGGFEVFEVIVNEGKSITYFETDFNEPTQKWKPATYATGADKPGCVPMQEEVTKFLRLGGEKRYGHGVQTLENIPVKSGDFLTLSFLARVPDNQSTVIVYLRFYDKDGKDVTTELPPTAGWSYSPYSKTHMQYPIELKSTGSWETVELPCIIPHGAAAINIAVSQWRGTHIDCRSLKLYSKSDIKRNKVDFDKRSVVKDGNKTTLNLTSATSQLQLLADLVDNNGVYNIKATLKDITPNPAPRALDLNFRLPAAMQGWQWNKNWRANVNVEKESFLRLHTDVGTHNVSQYPFTSVSKDAQGFALATPMDKPGFEVRTVDINGIYSTTAIGMVPREGKKNEAVIDLVAYAFDGNWQFRAATQKYYDMYGHLIQTRTDPAKEGCWLWPNHPSTLPENAEDFGLAFWEAPANFNLKNHGKARDAAHKLGIGVYPYTEAWGMRMKIAPNVDNPTYPSYEERLQTIKDWASKPAEKNEIWFFAPRHIAAQAALNSFPIDTKGEFPFAVDRYDGWFHWWRTNADPRLPKPNRASINWDYVLKNAIPHADGIYLDSVSYSFSSRFLNTRKEHLAVMDENLTYESTTGIPAADGIQHQVAFVKWLSDILHPQGKLIFGNTFGIAHRFNAMYIDIYGSEIGAWGSTRKLHDVQDDAQCCEKRFYARHRPIANLLQEGNYTKPAPEVTHEEMKQYLEHQLFYGFYPGVSTIGGEEKPGYANWKRYFGATRQCERDRNLFKEIVPLIRRLNTARWEPVTYARADNASILIERYGNIQGKEVLFTVRNHSEKPVTAILAFDAKLGKPVHKLTSIRQDVTPQRNDNAWTFQLAPWQTVVLKAE